MLRCYSRLSMAEHEEISILLDQVKATGLSRVALFEVRQQYPENVPEM